MKWLAIIPLLLIIPLGTAFADTTTEIGKNYNQIIDWETGVATWTSHPERIMINGEWENYSFTNNGNQVIFKSEAIGGLIYDIPSCSYSLYDTGFDGPQIIPSVSIQARSAINGTDVWSNMAVNNQSCDVDVIQNDKGIIITSTKLLQESETLFSANGTQLSANPYDTERLSHELILDVRSGIKETFRLYNIASDTKLAISQTVHTGNEIRIGDTVYDVASVNGQVFPKSWIIENEAEILGIADNLNYDFDVGIERLNAIRVIDDFGTSKVVMDYAASPGVENFIEIDPNYTLTVSNGGYASTSGNCSQSFSSWSTNNNEMFSGMQPNDSSCYRGVLEWDISSIPDTTSISDVYVVLTFTDTITSGGWHGANHDLMPVLNEQPSNPSSNAALGTDIAAGTPYVSNIAYSGLSIGTDYTYDLGSAADTDLQNQLSDDWFALGGVLNDETDSGGNFEYADTTYSGVVRQLVVSYVVVPTVPLNLATITGIPIELDWDAPADDGGSAITNYKVYRTTNQFALTDMPDSQGSDAQIDMAANEILLHLDSVSTGATFSDDMDSSSGWTQVADDTAPSITGGKLVGTNIVLNNENRIHKAIGTTLSDTAWVLQSKITISAPNNNNGYFYPLVISNGNGDFNQATSVDMIFFLVDGSSATGYFRSQDGTTQTNVATGQGHVSTFWIDMIRDGSTMTLKGYTSEANQNSGTTSFNVNFSISGTVSGLDTIQSGSSDFNSATQSWEIDWIKIYDGTTTVPSPTTSDTSGNNYDASVVSGTIQSGIFDNEMLDPNLTFSGPNIPDGTDAFTIAGWYKQVYDGIDFTWDSSTGVGVGISGNTITKTAASSWTSGIGRTVETIGLGGELTFESNAINTFIGLSNVATLNQEPKVWHDVKFGFSDTDIVENANLVSPDTAFTRTVDDVMKITISSAGVVKYFIDDVEVHESTTTASGDYFGIFSAYDQNESMTMLEMNDNNPSTKFLEAGDIKFNVDGTTMSVAEVSGVPSSGLLAYYELDEASGTISNTGSITGIDGTANGSPTYSTTAIVNNGIDFDGSDYFELGSSLTAWKFLHDGSDWTISFWMKLNSGGIDTGVQNSIMGTGQGGMTEGLDITIDDRTSSGRDHLLNIRIECCAGADKSLRTSNGYIPKDTNWHHYVLTNDASASTIKAYRDGGNEESSATTSYAYGSNNQSYEMNLGWDGSGIGSKLNGVLDSISVFDHVIDSDTIDLLYNSGSGNAIGLTTNTILTGTISDSTAQDNFYTFTRGSSNDWEIFQNGVSKGTATDSTSLPTTPSYAINLSGSLDEYFINSVQESDANILTMSNRGVAPTVINSPTASEYDDSGVSGGNTYYYQTSAVNSVGESPKTALVSGLAGTPPDPPSGLTATIQDTDASPLTVRVSYSNPSVVGSGTLSGFEIYRDGTLIDTVGLVNIYDDTVPNSGTFVYKARAISTHGTSTDSNTDSITTPTSPSQPSLPSLSIANPDPSPLDITVQWLEPSDGGSAVIDYNLKRSSDNVTFISIINSTSTAVIDTVPNSGTWYYSVAARNNVGTGPFSLAASQATPTVPATISDLGGAADSNSQTTINWSVPSNGGSALVNYAVYRDSVFVTNTTSTSHIDTGLTENTQYDYTVKARNNVGLASASNTHAITTHTGISGTITGSATTIGATSQIVVNATVSSGTPTPTFSTFVVKQGNTTITSFTGTTGYIHLQDALSNTFTVESTDNSHWQNPTISGTLTGIQASYDPTWSNGVAYNFTRTSTQMDVIINRDTTAGWDLDCEYRTSTQAAANATGIHGVGTNMWAYQDQQNIASGKHVYVSCVEDSNIILSFTSYGPNLITGGLNLLDVHFGDWLGTPAVVLFIVLVAGLFTGRTANTGILVVLALIGVLGFVGFMVIDEAVWGFVLVAGILGLFVGRRFL